MWGTEPGLCLETTALPCVCYSLSGVQLFATPRTVACQGFLLFHLCLSTQQVGAVILMAECPPAFVNTALYSLEQSLPIADLSGAATLHPLTKWHPHFLQFNFLATELLVSLT